MSAHFHAVQAPIFIGFGYFPFRIPSHHVDREMGINGKTGGLARLFPRIWDSRKNPSLGMTLDTFASICTVTDVLDALYQTDATALICL
jgi:hypothetical protein